MELKDILSGSSYSLDLFETDAVERLQKKVIERPNKKGGNKADVPCIIRAPSGKIICFKSASFKTDFVNNSNSVF